VHELEEHFEMTQHNQQLLQVDATSPCGVHLNYFRKYTSLGWKINCIPRRGQSTCNYATSHNSDLFPLRDSIVRRPCTIGTDTLSSPPRIFPVLRTRRNERTCKSRFVQTTSRPRRTRGAPFPRGDILRIFCTFVLLYAAQNSVGVVPTFSNVLFVVLRCSSARSSSTDRWNLDWNLSCFKPSHFEFSPRFTFVYGYENAACKIGLLKTVLPEPV